MPNGCMDVSLYDTLRDLLQHERPAALITVLEGPKAGAKAVLGGDQEMHGSLDSARLESRSVVEAQRLLKEERSETLALPSDEGEVRVFIEVFPRPRRLVIVGASDTAIALTQFGKSLGYRVIVTDARAAFATRERFPNADELLKGWPQDVLPNLHIDEATYVVLLSHDPKFDRPTLEHVLPTATPYIGAIGSRKTQRERFEGLREAGFTEEQLTRLHGPIGLDLGGRTPEEMALAIISEITAVRHGRSGGLLRDRQRQEPGAADHAHTRMS